jgi:hypothetical protein
LRDQGLTFARMNRHGLSHAKNVQIFKHSGFSLCDFNQGLTLIPLETVVRLQME